ncbi:Uncharacterised protein [Salmonella enterica subsp. enterica serovar Bovismorbificans]|nr:Uncharacterised protein [Salmonella enterica subsp. enterica serovar Bovismorbificans]CNV02536.1 Uncharacterised protein [Salmonella enterica subsp. enterica serovar Bovismorbificans]
MQHAQFTQRMLHLTDRPVGYHAHGRLNAVQQRICARDRFQFGIEQARHFRAVHRLQLRLCQRNAMLFTDGIDNFVELYAFKASEYFRELKRNAELPEHSDIGTRANHFTVDQRAVTVKKHRFDLGHVISILTSLTFT